MYVIGRGRYARETYPEANPGSAAIQALRNRNVAVETQLVTPFTPATGAPGSLLAALLYTPKVSGVIQLSATLDVENGANPDTYSMRGLVIAGTNLSVTGGASTSNGWVIGSTVPPVVGGSGLTTAQTVGSAIDALAAGEFASLSMFGISQPLPVGVPVVIEVLLGESGSGNPIAVAAFLDLSILELP